jgi:hypothetical protein
MSAPSGERLGHLVAKMKAPRIGERLQATAQRGIAPHDVV